MLIALVNVALWLQRTYFGDEVEQDGPAGPGDVCATEVHLPRPRVQLHGALSRNAGRAAASPVAGARTAQRDVAAGAGLAEIAGVRARPWSARPGDLMFRDFFLGFIKVHILHHAAQEPIYGLAMMEELQRHGYDITAGTLYPILHAMEEAGWLVREDRVVGGRIRKYYGATDEGRVALEDVKGKIRELVDEVLEGHGPKHLPEPGGDG